jgi:hypothetical protein
LMGVAAILMATSWLSGAQAQFLTRQIEEADGYRLFQNPSPRLGGMGLLGIAVEDENNEINLFDYIGSPAGLLADRDSTSFDFQYDFARNRTDWKGVDPLAYSPVGPLWPNFLDFGSADLQTRFSYQRYNALAAYRDLNNLSIAARTQYIRSNFAHDVTKFDVSYITAAGDEDDLVPDTLFVDSATRDSITDVRTWIFDIMADKDLDKFHVAGHAVFSFEDETPNVLISPDSVVVQMTRPVVVDTTTDPNGAARRREMPVVTGDGRGAGAGLAFSYEAGDHVTLGTSGDVLSTRETIRLGGPFFRQELTRNSVLLTGKLHSLFKLGRILEGAVKHQSQNLSGDGKYFWSFGCPQQGGGYNPYTAGGPMADRDGWEERTGTRWLIRVPETSIKLAVEYESARGALRVKPADSYSADVFVVPGDCTGGDNEPLFPRYAAVLDDVPLEFNYDEKNLTSGASLTLWLGRRPLTLASEYQSWRKEAREVSGWNLDRDLSLIKAGTEFGATRKITLRAGGVWGREKIEPTGGIWNESTLTLGGTYVLVPGLRQIEVAYMYRTREPDFVDIYHRETSDHRLTAYTRIYF